MEMLPKFSPQEVWQRLQVSEPQVAARPRAHEVDGTACCHCCCQLHWRVSLR